MYTESLLSELETSIHSYVKGTGKKCIAIIEKDTSNKVLHTYQVPSLKDFHGVTQFAEIFIKFIRNETLNGNELGSIHTVPIHEIIQEKHPVRFQSTRNSKNWVRKILKRLTSDHTRARKFLQRVTEKTNHKIPEIVRAEIRGLGVQYFKNVMNDVLRCQPADAVGSMAAHLVTERESRGFVTVKTGIASLIKYILAKVALTSGWATAVMIALWVTSAVALAIKEIRHFPDKLGRQLGKSVCQEIRNVRDEILNDRDETSCCCLGLLQSFRRGRVNNCGRGF